MAAPNLPTAAQRVAEAARAMIAKMQDVEESGEGPLPPSLWRAAGRLEAMLDAIERGE